MSDKETFMTLPSLVRQALERNGGEAGAEVEADAFGVINVNKCDWLIIRDHLIDLQDMVNKASLR